MNVTLLKTLAALAPVCMLLSGAVALFLRDRTASSSLQLSGALCLVVVVLAHVCEEARWFSWMGWGLHHSAGHYLDLSSAVVGLTMFPLGYLLDALGKRDP